MIKYFFISSIILLTLSLEAQEVKENWIPISIEKDESLFINVNGISSFLGDDIFIWSLQELNPSMTMEEVKGDIFKVKTYYLINKRLMRYSILDIIFYDLNNNVLKNYHYENKYQNPEFKYNYPIIRNSEVDKILTKALEFIPKN
jgi:hypothetical protein